MKSDADLLNELKEFSTLFYTDYNMSSYIDGSYYNCLGDTDIRDTDWDASEALRNKFEA